MQELKSGRSSGETDGNNLDLPGQPIIHGSSEACQIWRQD